MSWPNGSDPFYLYNQAEANARRSYYAVNYVPTFRFDGKKIKDPSNFGTFPAFYAWMRGSLDSLSAIPSKVRVNLDHTMTADLDSVFVSFDVVAVDTFGTFTIYLAGTEDSNNVGTFGYKHIMRDMVPSGSGSSATFALGDSLHYEWSYQLPHGQVDAYSLIWVQNPITKKVMQAGYKRVGISTDVETGVPPLRIALEPNVPNPFNPETTIRFRIGEPGEARLIVCDPAGRFVRELFSGRAETGDHAAVWDGRDRSGREVGSGVYFYRLDAGDASWTRSMVLIR